MEKMHYVFIVFGVFCFSQSLIAVTVYNPNYQVDTYVSYNYTSLGRPQGFTFDPGGNLYVTHLNGSVQKINTSKTISPLVTNLAAPRYITWGGGTDFGDYLYVTDPQQKSTWSGGEVTRIDLAGNKTPFAGGVNNPGLLEIDTSGNYNNLLYVANATDDKILKVGSAGGVATTFSNYPYYSGGVLAGIAFDTIGSYGNRMFVSTFSTDLPDAGVFRVDLNGTVSRFVDIEQAAHVEIDNTQQQLFDGKMYVNGKYDSNDPWGLYLINGYYDQELFGTFDISPNWLHSPIRFGADGAMYVMECDIPNDQVIISRITPVPEPSTLMLVFLGGLLVKKKR